LQRGPSPAAALEFECELAELLREIGREVVEFAYNQIEPEQSEQLPHYLQYEAGQYRRLNRKTPNRDVATLFGKITLRRHGYRYVERDVAESSLFPLEMQLGLVEGATPALADQAARALAETGATQQGAIALDFRTAAGRSFYAAKTGAWSVSNWLGLLNPSDW
jgi:hypothetical protein